MVNTTANEALAANIDPYALLEALTGKKIERPLSSQPSSASSTAEEWTELRREGGEVDPFFGKMPNPDPRPQHLCVGATNPYALVEAIVGHRLDRRSTSCARIMSDVLQTDYDELFDMRHDSVLYAGLKLNRERGMAEELNANDMKILKERDLVTPDLSRMQNLRDLERLGLKNFGDARVKMARMQNGKLRIVIDAEEVQQTVNNREVTMTLNELCTRFRRREEEQRGHWTPPNSSWRDVRQALSQNIAERMYHMNLDNRRNMLVDMSPNNGYMNGTVSLTNGHNSNRFDDPCQGATSNSWLIAAIFSVFWADPAMIRRAPRDHQNGGGDNGFNGGGDGRYRDGEQQGRRRRLEIRFHDQGGRNNGRTQSVAVNYDVPVNNSSNDPVYCRSSDGADIWPSLYEKAFAKWITGMGNNDDADAENMEHDRPDITQTAHGDPVKAMAQINGREPHYYFCENHRAEDLVGLVRACSVNFKCIEPMVAFTHASGDTHHRRRRNHRHNGGRDNDRDNDRDNRDNNRDRDHKGNNHKDNDGKADASHHHNGGGSDDDNDERRMYDMRNMYRGSNLVANHAYSVLGWCSLGGGRQYIIVRNPWGVTEPAGLTSYPGLIDRVEPAFWRPICLCDTDGVMAVEVGAFREYFACLGVAK